MNDKELRTILYNGIETIPSENFNKRVLEGLNLKQVEAKEKKEFIYKDDDPLIVALISTGIILCSSLFVFLKKSAPAHQHSLIIILIIIALAPYFIIKYNKITEKFLLKN